MSVIAYVSGHGFGHAAREVDILRRLPRDIPLVIKSASPEWFWHEEMPDRPFTFVSDRYDIGCVQRDSIQMDVPATLNAWRDIDAHNSNRWESETDDLRKRGARLIVSDVASFPLALGARMGLPSILVANFTWADIYADFVDEEPGFAPIVDDLISQYRTATLCMDTYPSLPMPYMERKEKIGLVCRPGLSRRDELLAQLGGASEGKRIALVYLGNWGYPIPYKRLEELSEWHFVCLDPPPVPVANWSVVPRGLMGHPDLVASVDAVVSKPGYGIVSECLSQGTPLLYSPRPGFAEYPALDAALTDWPGGIRFSENAFLTLDWADALSNVPKRGGTPVMPADGGERASRILTEIYENGSY